MTVEAHQDDAREPVTQEDRPETTRPGKGRFVAQIVIAAVAALVFVGLLMLWLNSDDVEGSLTPWFVLILVVLGVFLIVQIVLLVMGRRDAEPDDLYEPEDEPEAWDEAPPSDDTLQAMPIAPVEPLTAGCPGCGTVFPITAADLEAGEFACQNCGRTGYVDNEDLDVTTVREETCANCGATYKEYLQHSECPECHTFNEY